MRKSTKGAVAASAAALLLIGAWGTQATWSDNAQLPRADMQAGHLKLVNANCGDGWLLAVKVGDPIPIELHPEALLTPGDLLTLRCTFKVSAAGANLEAELNTTTPTLSGAKNLRDMLHPVAEYQVNDDVVSGSTATLADDDTLTATIRLTFDRDAGNVTQDLIGALNAITVTATQV